MAGKIILPPNYETINGKLVFLAGPIQGAPDWQQEAIDYFKIRVPNLNVASPRRHIERKGEFSPEMYNEQVDWETHHLRRASQDGAIMFWLAREAQHDCGRAYAQTSRFELGEWKTRHERDGTKLVVGIAEGFTNRRYLMRRLSQDCPEVPVCSTLEETCRKIVEQLYI